jgi:hypothetical protein
VAQKEARKQYTATLTHLMLWGQASIASPSAIAAGRLTLHRRLTALLTDPAA